MLYSLEQVLAGRKTPITVRRDAPVIDALDLMMAYRVGQLPVVDDQKRLVGIISQQSLLGDYFLTGGKISLLDLAVSDCMEPAQTLPINDDLLHAVDRLRQRGTYAIVVTREEQPAGILTGKDMSVFFRSLFEGMLLIERMEKHLQATISAAFPDEDALNRALIATFGAAKGQPDKPARGGRYLSFSDLLRVIDDADNWPLFQPIFGHKPFFEALMDRARVVRNQVAHFQGHPGVIELDVLRRAVRWLDHRPPLPAPAAVATAMTPADEAYSEMRTLARVLAGRKPPTCASPETPLRETLRVMIENRYGQLPVVDDGKRLLGMVSQQSILHTYYHTEGAVDLLDLPTAHCMDPARILHPDEDLFAAVELLATTGVYAAVVIDDDRPIGLLTGKDMTHFFRTLFEGIILIERIETKLREYAAQAYPDAAALNAAAKAAFGPGPRNPELPARNPNRLNFGDRVGFMCDDDIWPAFEPVLGSRELFMHLMDRVRRVRNNLLHFKGQLSYPEHDALLRANIWLSQRPALAGPAPAPTAQGAGSGNPYLQFMQRPLRTSVPEVARDKPSAPVGR